MTRIKSRVSEIKKARRESTMLRIISSMIHGAILEMPSLSGIFVNRVELSPGKSVVNVYFGSLHGKEHFQNVFSDLTLFKPSIRKALADELQGRYAVEIVFRFDEQLKKAEQVERLLNLVSSHDNACAQSGAADDTDL